MAKFPFYRWREWIRLRLYPLLSPLIALVLLALLNQTPLLRLLEDLTINLRFQMRAPFDRPADPRLILVGIDQRSIDHLGAWPWPRTIEADFLKTIANSGTNPHTVVFDLLFTDDYDKFNNLRSRSGENYDESLGSAAGELGSVITGALYFSPARTHDDEVASELATRGELAQPGLTATLTDFKGEIKQLMGGNVAKLPVLPLRKESLFGFVNDSPSPFDHIRHVAPLVIRVQDKIYPSLSLQILCQMLNVDPDQVHIDLDAGQVVLKNSSGKMWTIPVDHRGQIAINFRSEIAFRNISLYPLWTALSRHVDQGEQLPPEADIANKTLVIGQVANGLTDLGPTPLQAQSPLVYTHLNILNNVLQNDYLHFAPWPLVVLGWLMVTWATLLGPVHESIVASILVPIAVTLFYVLAALVVFWLWSLQIALAWPIIGYGAVTLGAILLRWREEQRSKQRLKQLFGRMLSPQIMDHLLVHPQNVQLGGSIRPVTILFSDIRDYTTFSESVDTEELVRQLNLYFERMVACVQDYGGTFHKFIGDAVMAAWGDIAALSISPEEDTRNAVRAALKMREQLRLLNDERAAEGLIPLRIGIGINHGEVLVGQIGASSRSEFTVIGDSVNVASRLEGMTKSLGTDLIIGESVRPLLGDCFILRRLGLVQLKGKTKPAFIYEVLAENRDSNDPGSRWEDITLYEQGLDDFFNRRFQEAATAFEKCAKRKPGDASILYYLKACSEFQAAPPPSNWDGRIVMETK